MPARQFTHRRMVAETLRRSPRSALPVLPIRAAADRGEQLGLSHPRRHDNYRAGI
jgi:hypothetical protein